MNLGVATQKEIYLKGMSGQKPVIPTGFSELEALAKKKMSAEAFAYVAGGAGLESTVRANREAFEHFRLKAKMMVTPSEVDYSVELFGKKHSSPIFAAPVGALELAHDEADLAVAKACSRLRIPMIFSNQASVDMETCAKMMGTSPRWFQLYWSKSDDLVRSLVSRAEKCGCEAIVVTLDTTRLGWRTRDLDLAYLPFIRAQGLAQYSSDPVFRKIVKERLKNPPVDNGPKPKVNLTTILNLFKVCRNYPGKFFHNLKSGEALMAVRTFTDIYMRPELRWEDLKRLREMTSLPILVKGIHDVEDAKSAVAAGVDGIIVSNHGGRQIDGGCGALFALEMISNELKNAVPLLFDSGIRGGADVIKALCLGAKAVLVGRPMAYALATGGSTGVEELFRNLLAETELQLSLMGVDKLEKLNPNLLIK